jgi:hypothetical protein
VVNINAGTQKFGLLKPPGKGTTVSWMQSASPAPTCWTIMPPLGNGNGAKLYTSSVPPVSCVVV